MINKDQFDKAMRDAVEASRQAEWTHEQRLVFYKRIEAAIIKECEEDEALSDCKN